MTTHTKLLEIIGRMGKVPRINDFDLVYDKDPGRYLKVNPQFKGDWLTTEDEDAHAHIELKGIECLPEGLVVGRLDGQWIIARDMDRRGPLFKSSVLADALLAALTYIEEHR